MGSIFSGKNCKSKDIIESIKANKSTEFQCVRDRPELFPFTIFSYPVSLSTRTFPIAIIFLSCFLIHQNFSHYNIFSSCFLIHQNFSHYNIFSSCFLIHQNFSNNNNFLLLLPYPSESCPYPPELFPFK